MITKPYTRLEYNSYLRNLLMVELMWPYGNRLITSQGAFHPGKYELLITGKQGQTSGTLSQLEQLYRYVAGFPTTAGLIPNQIPYYYRDYARDYNRFFGIKSP